MDHEQNHHHDTDCCCGHDHDHHDHHDHDEVCCPDHSGESGRDRETSRKRRRSGSVEKRVYVLEGLDCPNCAAKIEQKVRSMPEVEDASVVYPTRQLQVTAAGQEQLLPALTALVQSIEPEVQVIPYARPDAGSRQAAAAEDRREMRINLAMIIAGAALLIIGSLLHRTGVVSNGVFLVIMLAGYLICGGEVIWEAFQNICRGQVFDENFLMSVATIGAFATGEYPEALGVMLFYRVGELFEQIATERSRNQIMDAVDLRPEVVNVIRPDGIQVLPAENAAVGDLLLVRPGDRIPLDGVVEEGDSFLDTSAITGEPVPVRVGAGSPVTSGCVNQNGVLKIRVEKPLEDSMVSRIMDAVENAAASKPTIDKFITRFCRVYTPCVCALALFTAIVPSLLSGNWSQWVYTALTFLVISCPCALVLSVPLAFFCGIGKGSKYNILFKGGAALESLCNIRAIALDKTGTITKGSFRVQRCITRNGIGEDQLLTMAAACESASSHPIGQSIVFTARERGLSIPSPEGLEETAGSGIRAILEGKEVLCGNRRLMAAHGVDLSDAPGETGTEVLLSIDGIYAGTIIIDDEVKADAKDAVAQLHSMGIISAMLTGDAQASADRVAREVGIDQVHAKLLPEQKFDALQTIREANGSVMFVGDGINDAPVLAGADVGAAMGTGADAAIEAADVVFMTGELSAIPRAIRIAKNTNRIARQNVVIALVIKFGIMALGLLGHANMWTAVFADTGVSMICILNSIRILYAKK